MKIGIIGTRGIPNRYGGFEQFAEKFAVYLAEKGHNVSVYNSSLHPYKENKFNGVNIIRKYDPENRIGTAGQFVYDALCIMDSRSRAFDVILQLGYTSSSVFSSLFPKTACIVTNMDGLEWKRSKYSDTVRKFLRKAERWAVRGSDILIADSVGIQKHLSETYGYPSVYIPYGAEVFNHPDESVPGAYHMTPNQYMMLVARLEPENNIETIIKAHNQSGCSLPLLIVGNYQNAYGQSLYHRYHSNTIRFIGPVYDQQALNTLRYYAALYFHGHSVGGTNPSLIEAMASHSLIVAHDNIFNRAVLGTDAFYFHDAESLAALLKLNPAKAAYGNYIENNLEKVRVTYNPDTIHRQLEAVFIQCTEHVA